MTPTKEIGLGCLLWAVGLAGVIATAFYVTRQAFIPYVIFSSMGVVGVVLAWCGIFDMLADDFEDEIKRSYKGE